MGWGVFFGGGTTARRAFTSLFTANGSAHTQKQSRREQPRVIAPPVHIQTPLGSTESLFA